MWNELADVNKVDWARGGIGEAAPRRPRRSRPRRATIRPAR